MGNIYSKIKNNLKKPWPYWVGGVLLGVLNVILLALSGSAWKVTNGFFMWGVGMLQWFGVEPLRRGFYDQVIVSGNVFINKYTILNIGIALGSLTATLLASQFKIKKIKNKKQIITALIGGMLMGYGSRIAAGCNIGAFFSGIPSLSLQGWVFGVFVLIGTGVGIKLLKRFVI